MAALSFLVHLMQLSQFTMLVVRIMGYFFSNKFSTSDIAIFPGSTSQLHL